MTKPRKKAVPVRVSFRDVEKLAKEYEDALKQIPDVPHANYRRDLVQKFKGGDAEYRKVSLDLARACGQLSAGVSWKEFVKLQNLPANIPLGGFKTTFELESIKGRNPKMYVGSLKSAIKGMAAYCKSKLDPDFRVEVDITHKTVKLNAAERALVPEPERITVKISFPKKQWKRALPR